MVSAAPHHMKSERRRGAKPRPQETGHQGPRNTVDHGLHPGQHPNDPPNKHEPHDERARPRDTGRHGA